MLPNTLNACGQGSPIIFSDQTTTKSCSLAKGVNESSLNTLAAQTLALGYNIKILPSFSGQTLASLACTQYATAGLTGPSTVNQTFTAAVALIDDDKRVLIAQRPVGKSMVGLWEFPGGKIEPGEAPEDTLCRELKEELDIELCRTCLAPFNFASHAYENFRLLMPLYLCHTCNAIIQQTVRITPVTRSP